METVIRRFEELSTEELYEIIQLRIDVFVVEQNCVYRELDDKDRHAYHVYLKEGDEIVAYLRVLDAGVSFEEVAIGRVLTKYRGKGLGNEILEMGIKVAKEYLKADSVRLEAQTYAKRYYEKHGFVQVSDEFDEDGIPHVQMLLKM